MNGIRALPFTRTLALCIAVMWSANSASKADSVPLLRMNDPSRADSISAVRGDGGLMVDLIDFALGIRIPFKIGDQRERLRLDMPASRLIFTASSPFVIADGSMKQMTLPLAPSSDGFLAPLGPLVELIAAYYPGEILFDPSTGGVLIAPPQSDLLGIRYQSENVETRAIILAQRNVRCKANETVDGGVELHFSECSVDTTRFMRGSEVGLIASVGVRVENSDVIIAFTPDSSAEYDRFVTYDDPPIYSVVFMAKSSARGPDKRVTKRLEQERNSWAFDVVVIDPGHGGKDPGAIGKSRLYEKTVVLDVGLKLRDALEKEGIRTVMTRDRDVFVPLAERTRIANQSGGKLFVSLHCNSFKDVRARGMETYFLSPSKSDRAMQVAMRENSVIRFEESPEQYKNLTAENFILLSMAQATWVKESQGLAEVIQESVSRGANLQNRGVDQAGFYVLVGAAMPAILFEIAYLSNKYDEKLLAGKDFRHKIAGEICRAVMAFLDKSKQAGY